MANANPDQIPLDDDTFDPEAEAAAMAAAMGFSSFGQQPTLADDDANDNDASSSGRPAKKRRYNSRVDAYVGPTPQGTGANDVPVQRRVFPPPQQAGQDRRDENEIHLDLDDTHNDENTSASNGPAPPQLPTSLPPKLNFTLPANPGLPPKPEPQHFLVSDHEDPNSQNDQHQNQNHGGNTHGGRDPSKPWYADYYDHSFNENPWERLEQQRGMEAVGVWLPTPNRFGHSNRSGHFGGRGGREGYGGGGGRDGGRDGGRYEGRYEGRDGGRYEGREGYRDGGRNGRRDGGRGGGRGGFNARPARHEEGQPSVKQEGEPRIKQEAY